MLEVDVVDKEREEDFREFNLTPELALMNGPLARRTSVLKKAPHTHFPLDATMIDVCKRDGYFVPIRV